MGRSWAAHGPSMGRVVGHPWAAHGTRESTKGAYLACYSPWAVHWTSKKRNDGEYAFKNTTNQGNRWAIHWRLMGCLVEANVWSIGGLKTTDRSW